MFLSRWPSLLLTLLMLIVVGICLKRTDLLLVDEVKATISIAFGFATFCLLLVLIWVLQRKPIHNSWPTFTNVAVIDTPNMHPRASVNSGGDLTSDYLAAHDQPPEYEDALINSKPISWMVEHSIRGEEKVEARNQPENCSVSANCKTIAYDPILSEDSHTSSRQRDLQRDLHNRSEIVSTIDEQAKISSSDNMTQLAFSIVKGFTRVTSTNDDLAQHTGSSAQIGPRHTSYCQLDVSQLMNQGSPPKYSEICTPRKSPTLRNQDNEPKAGSSS